MEKGVGGEEDMLEGARDRAHPTFVTKLELPNL
jgi:hypothetical protein